MDWAQAAADPRMPSSSRASSAQIEVNRFNAFLSAEAAAEKAADAAEVTLWAPGARAAGSMHPLSMYDVRTAGSIGKGKGLVDPSDVISYEARPLLCSRTSALRLLTAEAPRCTGVAGLELPVIDGHDGAVKLGLGVQVHNGRVFNPDPNTWWIPQEKASMFLNAKCGFLLHLANLFGPRIPLKGSNVTRDTSWQWVFDDRVKPVSTGNLVANA